jgi:hypothetical protein
VSFNCRCEDHRFNARSHVRDDVKYSTPVENIDHNVGIKKKTHNNIVSGRPVCLRAQLPGYS